MINEDKKSRGQEVKQKTNKPSPLVGERIYGRTSETSLDCEQIEQAVAIATFAKLCERGVNSRQGRVRGNYGLPRFARNDKAAFTLAEVFLSHFAGRRKIAFTLAEVLITLGIVGIVAAMTLPALITKHQQQATISALKKNYSLLTNAINRAKSIYGDDLFGWSAFPDYYNNQKTINHIELLNILKNSGVNIIEITNKYQAQYTVVSFCGVEKYTKTNGGAMDVGAGGTGMAWGMLPDGACWTVSGTKYPNTSEIALDAFYIDINGAKKPNKLGRDLFVFTIKRNGQVIPYESSRGVWAQCSSYWQCSGQACAEKIMWDGWQIKKGYPW